MTSDLSLEDTAHLAETSPVLHACHRCAVYDRETLGAIRRHLDLAYPIKRSVRLLPALWLIVAAAIQPVLTPSQSGAAASTESHFCAPKNTLLLASPTGLPSLFEKRGNDSDPPSEKRGLQRGQPLAGSIDSLEVRFGSYRAGLTPHRLPPATGRGCARAPRAPPLMHG